MVNETSQIIKKKSDLGGENYSSFSTNPSFDKPNIAYQLCIQADALRLAHLHQEALSKYLSAILVDRKNPDLYYGLGICYKFLNNTEKAINTLEKAQKLKELDYNIYYELGVCHLISGDLCSALKNLIKSIKLNPKNITAQIQLALVHELMEENNMALTIYEKIIETSPKYIKAYNHKAALLMNMENYLEASITFNKILKLNLNYYRAFLGIGICFDKLGKNIAAVRYYKKFLISKPNSHHASFVKKRISKLKSEKQERIFTLVKN